MLRFVVSHLQDFPDLFAQLAASVGRGGNVKLLQELLRHARERRTVVPAINRAWRLAVALGVQRSEPRHTVRVARLRAKQSVARALKLRLRFGRVAARRLDLRGGIVHLPGDARVRVPLPGERRRRNNRAKDGRLRFGESHKFEQDKVESGRRAAGGKTRVCRGSCEYGGSRLGGAGQQGNAARARWNREAALAEKPGEPVERAGNAFAGSVFVHAQRRTHIAQAAFLQEAQHQRQSVAVAQVQKPFVEQWNQGVKRRRSISLQQGDLDGRLLAAFAAQFRANAGFRFEDRSAVQPTGERLDTRQPRRLSGERDEDILRNLLGQTRVTDLPEGRRINQMDVPCHERAKGGFRASRGVGGYEFAIRRYRCHSAS